MTTSSEDSKYFDIINSTLIAPIFFFLALVMAVVTIYSLLHAAENPKNIVLSCLMFVLGYNSFRFGKKLKGTCSSGQ
jgi:hypothetical protein